MASVDGSVRLKKGQEFVSKFGTNLRLTILDVSTQKKTITCSFERKVVDRKTGEITVEDRTREVTMEEWPHVQAGYVPARST